MKMHFSALKDWLNWQEAFHGQVIDLGLERVNAVYRRLLPHGNQVLTITVAGTNGKGSCVALLAAIYQAQGYRVAAYTSPHILRYNERIAINGVPVSDDLICAAFERIEACREDVSLSYFEFSTLAALDIFSREQVDLQLLEVGLGGRLDAVNIIDCQAAIISSIGIDHAEWLGNTREAIATEKAGIFRPTIPAIVGDPHPPETLRQAAKAAQAEWLCVGEDFQFQVGEYYWSWQCAQAQYDRLPLPALKGKQQFYNASAVLMAIEQLQVQLPVSASAIRKGLQCVKLQGRFQLITAKTPILLDVGHNPQAVSTLYDYLSHTYPQKRIHTVFAIMKDKDIAGVLAIMQPLVSDWFLAPLDNQRAASADMLLDLFAQQNIGPVYSGYASVGHAVADALSHAHPDDLIIVFGSFFLVSAFLAEFKPA